MSTLSKFANIDAGQGAPQGDVNFNFQNRGHPFVRAGSLAFLCEGGSIDNCEFIESEIAEKHKLKLYPKNSIVFAKSGMSAKIGRVYRLEKDAYVVNHLAIVQPNKSVSAKFLEYYLQYHNPRQLIKDDVYPSIGLADIRNYIVNIPEDGDEQKRIATILDQADALRQSRRQAIKRLNDLSQSIFYEMFGDPSSNSHGFPVGTIRDLVYEVKYGTSKKAHVEPDGFPILRMGNITYGGEMDVSDLKYVHLEDKEVEKYTAQPGDILFNRTNSKELVGKTTVFNEDKPYAIAGYLVRARTNKKANPYYIAAYLNSPHGKATLLNMCKNIVGMANINAQEFQDIKIIIPPTKLQNQYQEKLELINKHKNKQIDARNELETLFLSLQQRAFREEL